MAAPRFLMPYVYWNDAAGVPLPGALLNFYLTDSDTRTPTYSDAALTTPNDNPVEADDAGVFPNIFLNPAILLKVVLTDQYGAEIWTADPVSPSGAFFAIPFEYLSSTPPASSAILGKYWFPVAVSFPANFSGSGGHITTNPTATFTSVITNQLGTVIGSMSLSTGGVFTFATTGGVAVQAAAHDTWIFTGPTADATAENLAWTLLGVPAQ